MTASVSCCLPARGLPARPCSPPPASILQAGVVDGECASRGCVGWDGLGRAVVWPLLLTCAGGSPLDLDLGLAAILSKPSSLFSLFSQVTDHICKLAEKGLRPSQIGVVLRDSHGVAQVSAVTGSCGRAGFIGPSPIGSATKNDAPAPGSDFTVMRPPCSWMIA